MNERPQLTSGKSAFSYIAEGLFFLLFCLFVWLVVDPRLMLHNLGVLTPSIPFSFSTGWPFLAEHLTRVGGPVEYGARLLSQFYCFGWAGTLILGAAANRKPVLIDGFISTAGALVAYKIEPFIRDYLIFSHRSVEPGHKHMQEMLGCKKPLLDLNFRLGEGTGAALAMNIVEASIAVLTEVATFEEAAVAGADK